MNRTNLEHLVVALAIQFAVWLVTHDWLAGALFAAGIFLGREHAQRAHHMGDPSKLAGYEALDVWRWTTDAQLDVLLPVAGVSAVVVVKGR